MQRLALILLFGFLATWAIHVTGWGQSGATPGDEYTFETSRRGFLPIEYPGLLNYQDAVRLLLRHEGSFHLPITRSFRQRRLAPEADLWELDLPQALKLRVSRGGIEVVAKPANLRLALKETFNLVTLLRNELDEPVDLKLIAGLGEAGTTDRWKIRPGLNYASLNLRPIFVGPGEVRLKIFAGDDLPQQGSPPESRIQAEATIPAEVVQLGNLRIRTTEDGRAAVRARLRESFRWPFLRAERRFRQLNAFAYHLDPRRLLLLQPRRAPAPLTRGHGHNRSCARHRIRDRAATG